MQVRPRSLKVVLAMALVALCAPAGASAQAPAYTPAAPAFGELGQAGPLLADVAAAPTATRGIRVQMSLAQPAEALIAIRRMPTGTLVSRRYACRAGANRWTLGKGLKPGRYSVRVIVVDAGGVRHQQRLAPLQVTR